jgi:AraC family transcriptional activator of pobA
MSPFKRGLFVLHIIKRARNHPILMKDIPIHKLADRGAIGLYIKYSGENGQMAKKLNAMGAHRDDHYIFFLIEKGTANMMIDFTEVIINAHSLYYVLPGQVHHNLGSTNPEGWFIAVDTSLIPQEYRLVFENQLLLQQPYPLDTEQLEYCRSLIKPLHHHFTHHKDGPFYVDVLRSLLNSFVATMACGYVRMDKHGQKHTRPAQISHSFKQLLSTHYKTEKRPAAYAAMLNISESYLNEALKKVTGFSVSYWITHEIMLEARRLLYYSEMNAKQVAHELGYDDHTYFSRLFKNNTGNTPITFRSTYRK